MIIDILYFIFLSLGALISLNGYGILLNNIRDNLLLNIISGYIMVSIAVTFVHFFLSITSIVIFVIFFIGLYINFKNFKNFNYFLQNISKIKYIFIPILFILIPVFISQKYHEDLGYYHLPYVINLISEKIIFGLGNINDGFIHNSIWLNVISLFHFKNNYSFITLPTYLLYVTFIIYSIDQIINHNQNSNSNYFLIICIFYLILKFTRISEFGNDIPALIYSILGIFFFLKYEEENNLVKKHFFFFTHVSFVIFALLIKFSSIPIIILTMYIFVRDFKMVSKEIFKRNFLFLYFLIILFFGQQFIYTGCFVFPSKVTCLDVSWFDNEFLNLSSKLELVNKSYTEVRGFISREEYLVNFNWVPYWYKRNYLEIIEHFSTMLIPIMVFLFLSKKNVNYINNVNYLKILIFFLIMSFIFWFSLSPVYRFGILYFLVLIFVSTVQIYRKKIFSKNFFITLLCLFLVFNFTKNINRINQKNKIFFGIEKIRNEYLPYDNYTYNKSISVFRPNIEANNLNGNGWQGRLCWDIPFICSYNKIKVNLIYNYYVISKLD